MKKKGYLFTFYMKNKESNYTQFFQSGKVAYPLGTKTKQIDLILIDKT